MNPTNNTESKIKPLKIEEHLFLSATVVAVVGFAAAFFTQNALAEIGFLLLGGVSSFAFWKTRETAILEKVDQDLHAADVQIHDLQALNKASEQIAEDINQQNQNLTKHSVNCKKLVQDLAAAVQNIAGANSNLMQGKLFSLRNSLLSLKKKLSPQL